MAFKSPLRALPGYRAGHEAALGLTPDETYIDKILGTGPIAYWPLYETSGTTIACLVNSAQNATANSDVSGWPPGDGIGDGNTALYFDGANDIINAFTATLAAAFTQAEGTIMAWAKVDAGAWTDGVRREFIRFVSSAGNEYNWLSKHNANNFWWHTHVTPANNDLIVAASGGVTNWGCHVLRWSIAGNYTDAYLDTVQLNGTQVTPGAWGNPLAGANIGAATLGPANVFQGFLAHVAVWNRPITATEITTVSTL